MAGDRKGLAAKAGGPLFVDNETQSHYNSRNVDVKPRPVNQNILKSQD
jgi:hypothetical protein